MNMAESAPLRYQVLQWEVRKRERGLGGARETAVRKCSLGWRGRFVGMGSNMEEDDWERWIGKDERQKKKGMG